MMAATTVEGEDRVLATAQQIVKSLNINTQATEDMILILSNFDNRLSNITDLIDGGDETYQRFESAEKLILRHDSETSSERCTDFNEYLEAVDSVINMTETLTDQSDWDTEVMGEEVARSPFEFERMLRGEISIDLGMLDMGEEVASRWSEEEERLYHQVVYSNPVSVVGRVFWEQLAIAFPSRTKKELVSYYFNVFILRRRAFQNCVDYLDIDSDDDEWHGSYGGRVAEDGVKLGLDVKKKMKYDGE